MDPTIDEALRQERIATIGQVRRSIVRISYGLKPDKDDIIIAGTIVSKTENKCVVLANNTFHNKCKKSGSKTFGVTFPVTEESYGAENTYDLISLDVNNIPDDFIKLDLTIPVDSRDYVKPAVFETRRITSEANLDVFNIPREKTAVPPIYSPGRVVDDSQVDILGYFFADIPVEEYAHFGSALFNKDGHIVGIIYQSQSRVQAWTVKALSKLLNDLGATYAADGVIIP